MPRERIFMSISPKIIDGLTSAEIMQQGLDYYEDNEVHNEVSRFTGINIDLIENFKGIIKAYESLNSEILKEAQTYDALMDSNRNPDKVARAALNASGVYLLERKNELKSKYKEVTNEGTVLSFNLSSYLDSKTPETASIMINGLRYCLEFPVVTRKVKKNVIVYSDGEIFRNLSMKIYNCNKVNLRPEQMTSAKHPDLLDWVNLVDSLEKTAKL